LRNELLRWESPFLLFFKKRIMPLNKYGGHCTEGVFIRPLFIMNDGKSDTRSFVKNARVNHFVNGV
jgi:hypothetical protein